VYIERSILTLAAISVHIGRPDTQGAL